ncbi:hypothetical protein [Hyalangium rubrum]|uniref:Uncharacterized protein n=1 Tax=Hyalangium rubrum TaxID=3103134 RepID=A0ABU5H2H2_9BACT|nr:hypothetical protein [Hyalangium sp. s54d21]MDY7227516.1 hypothetical protein [Hyalangium sp. s54d21]
MSRLKLDSAPALRISIPRSTVEPKAAPQRQEKPQRADRFETGTNKLSGRRAEGDVFERSGKADRGAKSAPGPVGSRPLPKTLEPLAGALDDIAKKLAGDSTLDSKDKLKAAIKDAVDKLGLSEQDARKAYREVKHAVRYYKGSDPDFGATGGLNVK